MKIETMVGAGASGNDAARGRRVKLATTTALAAIALGAYFSPLMTDEAYAACSADTSGSPSPDTLECTGTDTDGIVVNSTDGNGLDAVIGSGAVVTNGSGGTVIDININQNMIDFDLVKPIDFDMSASNTSIVGQGTAIDISRGGALSSLTGDVTIGGNVQSTLGNAIVLSTTAGTGNGTLDVHVTDTGSVEGYNNGITYTSTGGTSNVNVTNDGDIFGGNTAVSLNGGLVLGNGTFQVINNGSIGNAGHAGTGPAISMTGLANNGIVTNNEDAEIYSQGDGINMLLGGNGTVTNSGDITSTGGIGVNLNIGSDALVTNNETGVISGENGGVNILALTGEAEVQNHGEIVSGSGYGINVSSLDDITIGNDGSIDADTNGISANALLGDVDVTSTGTIDVDSGTGIFALAADGSVTIDTQSEDGYVTSVGGSGIVGVALTDGDVSIDSGAVNAGSGGVALPAPLDTMSFPVGGGVIAVTNSGAATVNAHDDISVDGGTFGAAAISLNGSATVNLDEGVAIDPPMIGAGAIVLGGAGDATVNANGTTIDATAVGAFAYNGGLGDANVNVENAEIGQNFTPPMLGVGAMAIGGGDADIEAAGSTVSGMAGIAGYTQGGGNVWIDSGTVNASGGGALSLGVIGVAQGGGSVDIDTHGDTTAAGLVAVGGYADTGGDVSIDLLGASDDITNVTGANGIGVIGVAQGGGDVDIEGAYSNVTAGAGILGYSDTGGNVWIDSGTVTASGGTLGVGVIGVAQGGGSVDIDTHGDTVASGLVAIGGFADTGGDVSIDLLGASDDITTVTAANGVGVLGIALDGGNVDIEGEYSDVTAAIGIVGFADTGGNVWIDSGEVEATGGALGVGVVGVALGGGNVDIDTHGNTTASGLLGVAGITDDVGNVGIDLLGSSDDITQVNAVDGVGVLGLALGSGDVDIEGEFSHVTAGAGIVGASLDGGNVWIDSGEVDATGTGLGGVGVAGIALDGNVDIDTHGSTDANGLFGVAALAVNGNASITTGGAVNAANGAGVTAIALGGDATVNTQDDIVQSAFVGVGALAVDGNVDIDAGEVTTTATGFEGSGVAGIALGGNADIATYADVTAGGTFGVLGSAVGGDVLMNIGADTTVTAANGAGVSGIAVDGNVDINAEGTTVESQNIGIGALALNGGVTVDSGDVHTTATGFGGSGVVGIAVDLGGGGGDATVVTHGKISVDNGLFGAAAIATGGNASLTIGGDIDPPDIGGAALAIGGDADLDVLAGVSVEADNVGLLAAAVGGNVDINADATSVITSGDAGVVGTAFGGDVNIDTGTVYANGTGITGVGITGVALGGEANITTHGLTDADGLFGIFALADENVNVTITDQTVNALFGFGVVATAGGDVVVDGVGSTINSGLTGIAATSITGNAKVDSGTIVSSSGSGVLASAFGGNTDIVLHGDVTANGLAGVNGIASGNVNIDLGANSITNTASIGVGAEAGGDVLILGADSTINSELTGIFALGLGSVDVESGTVSSANGSGVIATALGGDATITTYGKITADNGLFGASATSIGGAATVTVNEAIDPPMIGASAVSFGSGAATVTNNSDIEANLIGINAANFGDGDVVVTNNGTVGAGANPAPLFGISVLNAGPGATTITNATDAEVYSLGAAVFAVANDFDPVAVDDISIVNDGLLQGDGDLLAAVMTWSDGSLSLANGVHGVITTDEIDPESGAAIWAYSDVGTIGIDNAGSVIGNLALGAAGVDALSGVSVQFENKVTGDWTFSGANAVYGLGDIVLNNVGIIDAVDASLSTFQSDEGDIEIANSGIFRATGYEHDFEFIHPLGSATFDNTGRVLVDGGLNFIGLDEFNNANRIDMVDADADDYLTTTGNYTASGPTVFAFNAELEANGASDYLVIGGDVSGTTHLEIDDLAAAVPGEYVDADDAIVFAYVGGAVSSAAPDFTTDGGIDKGLYRFDAYLRDTPKNTDGFEEWVLASNLDREAFDLSTIAYGAQNLWNVTTGTWLDRTADLRNAFGDHGEGQAGNVTPGVWGRMFGANIERDMSNTVGAPAGLSGGGVYNYDDQISQDFFGLQMGVDFGSESVSAKGKDRAWLFGVLGGWVQSDLKFDMSNTAITYDQWSVGAYATRLDGPFFADLLLKADFGTLDYSMNDGVFGDSFTTHYTTLGATLDLGYKLALGSGGAFFEPKGTLSYGNTKFDNDLPTLLGTGVEVLDSETLRSRLGGRLGYTAKLDSGTVVEPYIEGNWWHEFEGDYVTNLLSNGSSLPVGYNVEGDQGEILGGISVSNGNNGWSFFLRGGTQFGEQGFAGYVGNLGVRKAFGKAATPPPPPVCNKGPYIVFFDWDKSDITPEAATTLDSAVTAYGNCGTVPIMLAGYADRSGSTQYNVGLSNRRNASVQTYLVGKGIPSSAISSEGFGEANPRVPTADGVRELQNRRVEISYGPGSGN
ncbi:hypothetical protein SZ64_08395 [Erythrobacter sp. SG61-1L]|nr:autotransporter outer membrane beta-barrel domain-containing protein [Erythrobacter sp. SG61-1L]KPL68137.1 hypothetical protein SZ64_08395 [Erythrobacter sp. SG61-1L]